MSWDHLRIPSWLKAGRTLNQDTPELAELIEPVTDPLVTAAFCMNHGDGKRYVPKPGEGETCPICCHYLKYERIPSSELRALKRGVR